MLYKYMLDITPNPAYSDEVNAHLNKALEELDKIAREHERLTKIYKDMEPDYKIREAIASMERSAELIHDSARRKIVEY